MSVHFCTEGCNFAYCVWAHKVLWCAQDGITEPFRPWDRDAVSAYGHGEDTNARHARQ